MYLFYMAWSVWKDSGTHDLEETPALENHLHIAVTGTLINVLNPKILLFSGFFATISAARHQEYCSSSHRAGAGFYGHDVCGVRFLRRVRRLGAPIRDRPPQCHERDQGPVCRQLWAFGSQACVYGKVKRRSAPKQNLTFCITGLQH